MRGTKQVLDEVVPGALDGISVIGSPLVVPILQIDEVIGFIGACQCIDHAEGLVRQAADARTQCSMKLVEQPERERSTAPRSAAPWSAVSARIQLRNRID